MFLNYYFRILKLRLASERYLYPGCSINTQILRFNFVHFLLLCLHNVWKSGIARFIESEIGRENCRKINFNCLQTSINFPGHCQTSVSFLNIGGKNSLQYRSINSFVNYYTFTFITKLWRIKYLTISLTRNKFRENVNYSMIQITCFLWWHIRILF